MANKAKVEVKNKLKTAPLDVQQESLGFLVDTPGVAEDILKKGFGFTFLTLNGSSKTNQQWW